MIRRRLVLLALAWGAVAVAAGALVYGMGPAPSGTEGGGAIGGPFTLRAAGGRTLTDEDFRGAPFAIFFGYTRCPDVCPTTLADLDVARDELGAAGDALKVVFVSVDYERDDPDGLQDFVGSFAHPVIGLTGSREEIEAIAAAYRVHYEKVPGEGGDYTVNHTAAVYLMDGEGRFTGTIGYGEAQDSALAKLRRLIEAG